jgi:hypothetical protein
VHLFQELDALFTIGEGFDRVNGTPQLDDGVVAVVAIVVNIVVQPDQEDTLYHLHVDPTVATDTF